jgi:DMSO/TMAO reductase YedYZ heme-binding membrane subunit
MVLLFVDSYQHYSVPALLVPGMAPAPLTFAAALGTIGFWLLMPVSFLGRIRAKMGLVGNAWFKRSHVLAYAAWPIATAHYVLAGTDALAQWSLALLFTATALIVMALLARGFVPAPGPVRKISPRRSATAS